MGTALATVEGGTPAEALKAPSAAFLSATNIIVKEHLEHWKREERRLYGGDLVLDELVPFDYESPDDVHYAARQQMATYINLPAIHASLMTGHVSKKRPKPGAGLSFGSLGEVRVREKIDSALSKAEMVYYNTDGIGQDASEWGAFWDGVYKRAEATGFRWVMVDVPRRDSKLQQILTEADEVAGARPFLVEWSPTIVQNFWYHNGELQFAVARPVTDEPVVHGDGTLYMPQLNQHGWYLFIRQGCTILGPEYAKGGWWLFDSALELLDSGDWSKTQGRIPLFPVFAEADPGTTDHPSIAKSQTMEIGQCAIGIMNQISARDFDAFEAAQSKLYVLGCDPANAKIVTETYNKSQLVFIPPIQNEDGSESQPKIQDGSLGAVPAEVFEKLLTAKFDEAERLMIEKATSSVDSSGAKQVAGFAEGSSPLLVRRAQYRQQAESIAIYFLELRWGTTSQPSGYAAYPDNYELAPLVDDIDAMFDTLRRAGAQSASLTVGLIMEALDERGVLPDDVAPATIKAELIASIQQKIDQANAATAAKTALSQGLNGLQKTTPDAPPATLPAVQPPSGTPPSGAGKPAAPKAA